MTSSETHIHINTHNLPHEQSIEDIIRPIKKAPKIRSDHDVSLIQEKTKHIPFFEKYILENKGDVHLKCCRHMTYEKFNLGDFVFQQGDRGSKFYIIIEGKIGIFLKNKTELKKVKELEGGESFGELALVNDAPRSASIKCLQDCHFAVLDKKNYITLFQQILDDEIKKEIVFYPEIELFSGWNYNKIKSFYTHSFRIKVKKGDRVINQDEPIDAIYIIVNGEFVVKKSKCLYKESDNLNRNHHALKRPSLNNGLQQHTKTPLFIMSRYEIFGQEGVETESQLFAFSVECESFEGNLIYIKLNDYMKIIWNDEAQKEYMKNYSDFRLQRVQDRIDEIQQIVSLKDKKDVGQDRTHIAAQIQQFRESHTAGQMHNPRKSTCKKVTKIDVLTANPTQISSNDIAPSNSSKNNNNNNANSSPNNMTAGMANLKVNEDLVIPSSSQSTKRVPTKQLISFDELDSNRYLSPDQQYLMKTQSSFRHSITENNQTYQSLGTSRSQRNSTSLLSIPNELHRETFELKEKQPENKALGQLHDSSVCFTPVTLHQQHAKLSQQPLCKAQSERMIGSNGSINSPILLKNSCSIEQSYQGIDNKHSKKPMIISQSQLVVEESRDSLNNISDNENNDSDRSIILHHTYQHHHHKKNSFRPSSEQNIKESQFQANTTTNLPQSQNNHLSHRNNNPQTLNQNNHNKLNLNHPKKVNNYLKKQDQQTPSSADEILHPLVKGFHEQLRIRFYNKFKNGQIEDLKSHMKEAPIMSLKPSKREVEIGKVPPPQGFIAKKKKELIIKELRDYEFKLGMIIKSDRPEATVNSISPFQVNNATKRRNLTEKSTEDYIGSNKEKNINSTINHHQLSNTSNRFNTVSRFDELALSPLSPMDETKKKAEIIKEQLSQTNKSEYFFQVKDTSNKVHTPRMNQSQSTNSELITLDSPLTLRTAASNKVSTNKNNISWNKSSSNLFHQFTYYSPQSSSELKQEKIPMKRSNSQAHQRLKSLENINQMTLSNCPSNNNPQASLGQRIGTSNNNTINNQEQDQNCQRQSLQLYQPYIQTQEQVIKPQSSQSGLHIYNFQNHSHSVFALSIKNFKNKPSHVSLISGVDDAELNGNNQGKAQSKQVDCKQSQSYQGNTLADYKDRSFSQHKLIQQQSSPTQSSSNAVDKNQNLLSKSQSCRYGFKPTKGFNLSTFQMNKDKILKSPS